jgi:hypothetical protein
MPVFARLSSRFYDVVGEDVTQQLVDWINAVEQELTDRARLRTGLVSASRSAAGASRSLTPVITSEERDLLPQPRTPG